MRYLLPLIALALLVWYTAAPAQLCPATPTDYQRQHRPAGQPANYPPQGEPGCYMQYTNTADAVPSCNVCHYHQPWRRA
jgi:hypothetical protein